MLCFEVSVNGQVICRAGIGEAGVLSTHVAWAQTSRAKREAQGKEWTPSKPWLSVGGLVSEEHLREHLRWLEERPELEIGDEVTIKIIEADEVDEPSKRKDAANPATARRDRYELYQMYKQEFEVEGVLLPEEEINSEHAKSMRRELYEDLKKELEGDS